MKYGIRIILCVALCALALTMAVFTLSGFSPSRPSHKLPELSEGSFVLGESDGNIAVFANGNMESPITVTNIELDQLREADRSMISAGLVAGSESELMQLLEDLGS